MKCYKYLYYNLYLLWLRKKDEPENAHINAVITLTFFLYVNLMSIPLILMAISRKEMIALPDLTSNIKYLIVGLLLLLGTLNYIYLGRKRKRIAIVEQFKEKTNIEKQKGILYAVLYLIITIAIPIGIFFFTKPL